MGLALKKDASEATVLAVNPMIYDVFRETATWLQACCLSREEAATNPLEKEHWRIVYSRIAREVRSIDPYDEPAVISKTNEYNAIRLSLPPVL